MTYLWNLLYLLAGVVAIPFLLWQRFVRGKRRAGWGAKFFGNVELPDVGPVRRTGPDLVHKTDTAPVQRTGATIWFHAVSVGEVNLLDPLVKLIATEHPDWSIYITVGTVTGFELAKKKYSNATVSYAPLDFSWAVRRAIERIKPTMLVLVELELWPNLIGIVHAEKIPVVVINGRLSEKSFVGYSRIQFLVGPVLQKIDLVAAQNEEYAERFKKLGADEAKVNVTGSLKFDGARSDRNAIEINELRAWAGIEEDDIVMVAGSTSEPEEEILFDAVKNLYGEFPNFKFVVVPRHPERFEEVARLIAKQGQPFLRRSSSVGLVRRTGPDPVSNIEETPVQRTGATIILVDRIGELGHWWGTATIGFVGGSLMKRGGQNMIEPAAFGVATCFGPNTSNFRDVVQMLLAEDAAVVVRDAAEIEAFVRRCLADCNFAKELGQRAKSLVQKQQGATARTLSLIEAIIVDRK